MMDAKNDKNWELITGKLYNELGSEENKTFKDYSSQNSNKSDVKKASRIYNGLKEVNELHAYNKERTWISISSQINKYKVRQLSVSLLKYAAVLVFALLAGWLAKGYLLSSNIEYSEIEVLNGQMGHVFLSDGTEVWLNSGSRFKYPNQFNTKTREVYLNGEAYFDVTSNKKKPFIVETSKMQVKVLGTSFNVMAYKSENRQEVVLEEGKVQINNLNGDKIVELKPGERILTSGNSPKFILDKVKTQNFTEWKNGTVFFEEENLMQIAEKLERWYNVEMTIDDDFLKNYKITGTILRNKPIDQVIQAIEFLAPVKCIYQNNPGEKDIIKIEKK